MGSWDVGHFDNDTAADFAYRLDEAAEGEGEALIRSALATAVQTAGCLEDYEGVVAVASAAVVAAQCPGGEPADGSYGPRKPPPGLPADLRILAARALDRVLGPESELAELWGETGENERWRQGIRRLQEVLRAGAQPAG
jgi:Domain of unknown function (DUF4259)